MVAHVAEHVPLKVGASAPRVDDLACERVFVDRVDREVASRRRLADGKRRVAGHLERAMPEAELRLAARRRDVDVEMVELDDPERCAHEVELEAFRENALEIRGGDSEALYVDVGGDPSEQPVAHAAADHQGPAAGRAHEFGDDAHAFARVLRRLPVRCSRTSQGSQVS